jgi:DNA-binding cell septation regulator SpoVG
MSIQVFEIKKVTKPGNLKAFVKIQIGETVFHDFRIVQQPGQKAWISPPQASWQDQGGKTHYKALIEFPLGLELRHGYGGR